MRVTFLLLICLALIGCEDENGEFTTMEREDTQFGVPMRDEAISSNGFEKAMFGAGCFWGVESAFQQLDGVKDTCVGYAGGQVENPTYKQVCTDRTGHAEVVQVVYDPKQVSYSKLLDVFWKVHDPTQVNRQGWDVGKQYRSSIFYFNENQKAEAERSKGALEAGGEFDKPIATQIEAAETFWPAEEYHQRYLEKRGRTSCKIK